MSRDRYIDYYTTQHGGGGSQHGGILIGGIMSGLGGLVQSVMRHIAMVPLQMMANRLMNSDAQAQQQQAPAQGGSGAHRSLVDYGVACRQSQYGCAKSTRRRGRPKKHC